MRSSNPVLKNVAQPTELPQPQHLLTIRDIVEKTGITLAVITLAAVANLILAAQGYVLPALILGLVGGIGALIVVIIAAVKENGYRSKPITLTYAVLDGLLVGAFTYLVAGYQVAGADAGVIVGQAIAATFGVFAGMLWLYSTGKFKVTPKFNKIMLMLIVGALVAMVVNFVAAVAFDVNPLRDGGPIAIAFSLFCIVLAALSFMTDFDTADTLIEAGAPKEMAWGVALGLSVTLVWLYTEILRLLNYFR